MNDTFSIKLTKIDKTGYLEDVLVRCEILTLKFEIYINRVFFEPYAHFLLGGEFVSTSLTECVLNFKNQSNHQNINSNYQNRKLRNFSRTKNSNLLKIY